MDLMKELEDDILLLRKTLSQREDELYKLKMAQISNLEKAEESNAVETGHHIHKLPRWAIERYSRQILLPEISVTGQINICNGRVLVVGAGGLGCPAASYLAGAGVGSIGLVDYDTVDVTNIHRQLLHSAPAQGTSKVESAASSLRRINTNIHIKTYDVQLNSKNASEIISKYDIVLDCSDNVPTRYLLNDACVLNKVPLISGSALKMEGQLTIYNYHGSEALKREPGPCYRCIFPTPPPPETVGSCSANGVVGPVPGTIGSLQALEALKYLVGTLRDKLLVSRMLIFDGADMVFRVVKLRGKNPKCAICSESPTITKLIDYEVFCKAKAVEKELDLKILPPENRISAKEFDADLRSQRHLVVDVRSSQEFQMCNIDGAVNYPIDTIEKDLDRLIEDVRKWGKVTFLCRRGNDSQIVAQKVLEQLGNDNVIVKDLTGGLHAWAKDVDREFPIY